jgi:feruloyl esterase
VVTRSRPLCPYPQTAIYNGSGSTDDIASFHCGGNLETREVVCADVLAKYKHEVKGQPDFDASGIERKRCERHDGR